MVEKEQSKNRPKEKRSRVDVAGQTLIRDISFCGVPENGSNASMVDVKDGKIIRIRPMHYDWKYDPKDMNPWKMESRGKTFEPSMKTLLPPYSIAYKNRVYSPARILHPMMRVDFDPNGNRNPQNRGISKYKRISWDQALDIIASEMNRIKEKYGPTALLYESDQHGENKVVQACHGAGRRLLRLWGGFTQQNRQPDSWEGWWWGSKHFWGCEPVGQGKQSNLLYDISQNVELLLFWGCDQETTPWGWQGQLPSRLSYWWTELGIKQIYVCPDLNYAAAVHANRWIPILPNTDAAMYLAITYHWFKNGTYDKEYLKTHAVGVEKYEAYVMGEEDGVPKTPEWAAPITGVPSRVIKALAEEWASKHTTVVIGNGGPGIRGPYATEAARLQNICLAKQGLGKPGVNQAKMIEWGLFDKPDQYAQPRSLRVPNLRKAYRGGHPDETNHPSFIPKTYIPKAILEGQCDWYGVESETAPRENQFVHYKYPADGCSKIHMVWTDSPSWITSWNCGNDYIRAMRHPDIEFMFAQHIWLENECLLADIILPVNTKLEEDDIAVDIFSGQYNLLFPEHKCIEPLGESYSDYEIVCKLAERLGLLEEYTEGKSIPDWIKYGWEISRCADLISWEELNEKGYYVVPTADNWEDVPAGFYEFYKDPDKHPLSTPTGKLEFEATGLLKHFPDDLERPPVPKWIAKGISHEETIGTERSKKYPLLVCSNHPRWGVHSEHTDMIWLREIETCKVKGPDGYQYQPGWLHPSEAEKRGIKNGDVISIYNDRGTVLAGVCITERIMPGVVYIDHGAKWDPIALGEIDRGGAINTIVPRNTTSKNAVGHAVSGFLAQVEKTDMEALRRKYPEAFERPFHPHAGPGLEGWIEGGK
ncbi:MAG: molybdopterin-dependent oxidoreductase [Candidatus Aminicenantes bacterium]|nr:molybdopterin-dependent oxidoreductase [Candidatus Aminicenantes bacterium]